jgi:hypothetical protein
MNQGTDQIEGWNPSIELPKIDALTERYSRGFLRCAPARWFPGLPTQWAPMLKQFGIEVESLQVRTSLFKDRQFAHSFVASMDGELLAIGFDSEAAQAICSRISPERGVEAEKAVLEYLCRRFVTSAALSWSGVDSSGIRFESKRNISEVDKTGLLEIQVSIDDVWVSLWLIGGAKFIEHFDGLWRRQLHSTSPQANAQFDIQIELGKLFIPRDLIGQYTASGATIDLGIPVSRQVVVLASGQPWLNAHLHQLEGSYALEIMAGTPVNEQVPSGHVRLGVELMRGRWQGTTVVELAQIGAMTRLPSSLSDTVTLVAGSDVVGQALLKTYQGRFVISVI